MAIVITNGEYYICYSANGGIRKTPTIEEAIIYESVTDAIHDMKKAPSKTEKYYVFDTVTKYVCWKWLTDEEKVGLLNRKEKSKKKKANKRKSYSQSVRKMIYMNADGRCQLCGRKILYEEFTLDHIIPLAMGGADAVENLQCACESCNFQKRSYLPEEFFERISQIFMYQMEKKSGNSFRWKIVHRVLEKIA